MSFLIIRLPIFNRYYIQRSYLKNRVIHTQSINRANRKAALVMSSLLSAIVMAGFFYALGVEQFKVECFVAAIASGVMSFYYEP